MMALISCIITDDEPFARKGLQGYVERAGFFDLRAQCENALELREELSKQKVDLLFLDIQMPHLTGIEFLKALANPPKVIFTTAFKEYAMEGFELEVLDYLLKPIAWDRFARAAFKARDYFESKRNGEQCDYLFVKSNGRLEKLILNEILFVEGMENYVVVQTTDKKLIIHNTLKNFLSRLPSLNFIQTHKSYIVAVDKVTSMEGNRLFLGKAEVPVSRQLRDSVMERIIKGLF